ncbi:hypothetical protein MBLNU230_g8629t1 [Neophaeotheca triangularis]
MSQGRVLFVDAYDSFSNNIINLLKDQLAVEVASVRIDDPRFISDNKAWLDFLSGFDGVVAGPGPGHPANAGDIGLIASLWDLPEDHMLPVLGICLGFQSLAMNLGATVERLLEPRHGLITQISHGGRDVFVDTGDVRSTQYHSLRAETGHPSPRDVKSLWTPSKQCADMLPLAWDLSDDLNGPILMSIRHCHKPLWGMQNHPESICTNAEGHKIISNWWLAAQQFNKTERSRPLQSAPAVPLKKPQPMETYPRELTREITPPRNGQDAFVDQVQCLSFAVETGINAAAIAELSHSQEQEPILLESGTRDGKPLNPGTGRYSILGLQDNSSLRVRYSCANHTIKVEANGSVAYEREASISHVFDLLDEIMKEHRINHGPADTPFWGGLVGFVSYEAGLETLDVTTDLQASAPADVWFVFVERSVVIDHVEGVVHVQSIRSRNDTEWLHATRDGIIAAAKREGLSKPKSAPASDPSASVISEPAKSDYCHKVRQCQECLRAGESYELCLTGQTQIANTEHSWSMYRRLRDSNPAPFGAYMHLKSTSADDIGLSIVSSSPERFLSWSREGKCEFRPIKGTVKKTPEMTREKAEAILSSSKEQAENLMIVDLIRHDLSSVKGIRDVAVPKLMTVEEYETVFQLVSVIQGQLPTPTPFAPKPQTPLDPSRRDTSGIDVLKCSLPPGSMTGAPKKRSCELLQSLEDHKARGIYSGVLGYMDVGGGGDFSVVIRTAFKWDGADEPWRIGAGGAVTVLSDDVAEFEEMETKRERLVSLFAPGN